MFKINIQGLKDGIYEIQKSCAVAEIPLIAEEYFGDVTLKGSLNVLPKRFFFSGVAECNARFICDISLKEFVETIKVNIKISFFTDHSLRKVQMYDPKQDLAEVIISEDEKYLDLTNEIREQLVVNLPMKRISPEYIGKTLEEIYPQYTGAKETKKKKKSEPVDDRWAPLAKLKVNKN
jgi:uncharacterized metal-binding protein YceD (DUF177 family)